MTNRQLTCATIGLKSKTIESVSNLESFFDFSLKSLGLIGRVQAIKCLNCFQRKRISFLSTSVVRKLILGLAFSIVYIGRSPFAGPLRQALFGWKRHSLSTIRWAALPFHRFGAAPDFRFHNLWSSRSDRTSSQRNSALKQNFCCQS